MKQRLLLLVLASTIGTTATFAGSPTAERMVLASSETSITITGQRITDDRIKADVMEVLANTPGLAGKIGVESHDQVVNLTGHLATSGQVWRAGRAAGRVQGVRYVVNEIRPRLGVAN